MRAGYSPSQRRPLVWRSPPDGKFRAHITGQGEGGGEAIITLTFSEEKGVTTVTTLMDFGSKELRDTAVATGMTDGMEQSYQLLERVLAEQR